VIKYPFIENAGVFHTSLYSTAPRLAIITAPQPRGNTTGDKNFFRDVTDEK
jgi:hypothetical protein